MKHLVSHAQANVTVYVDLIHSLAAKRVSQQPQLLTYASEVIQQEGFVPTEAILEYDMGRQIGFSPIMETTGEDKVFYARLVKDDIYTRFVKSSQSNPTQIVTLCLKQTDNGNYELYDLWLGRAYPPRPGSDDETGNSKAFWLKNAFMFDNQPIQTSTITKTCPY